MKIISKKDAKAKGLKRYCTGRPCGAGHVAQRLVSNAYCCQCSKENVNRQETCSRLHKERKYLARDNHATSRDWYNRNPDKRKEINQRKYKKRLANGLIRYWALKRKAHIKQATPAWANQKEIKKIYKQCSEMSLSGQRYEVDHIVPLRGKLVCGLHVHYNLQILTEDENQSKKNKWVDPYT